MGGARSSSKRKSSRKKSSKISSETRRKRRNRRTKSRKLRSSDDSSSYSDYSSSSVSVSSFSSEDEYRMARSRSRSEVKGRKKRSRRSSSSRGSSEDSRRVKKIKGSKRSARKKSLKKKRRRVPSVSSISSDSRSCSTCRDGSSKGEDSEFQKHRGRSREKRERVKDFRKTKGGTNHNKITSISCSSRSRSSDGSAPPRYDDIPQLDYSSRRLRSVITIPKSQETEENAGDKDGHKEEILYDPDDYPSSRSNDSNEESSKRELAQEVTLISDFKHSEPTKSGVEGGAQDYPNNPFPDEVVLTNSFKENKNEVFSMSSNSNSEDLESILRLKALENLKKYRGGLQTNAKPPAENNKNDSNVKQLSTTKDDFVQNKTHTKDGIRVLGTGRVLNLKPKPTMGIDSVHQDTSYGKVQEEKRSVTESQSVMSSLVQPNQVAISSYSKKDLSTAGAIVTNKSESVKPSPKQGSCRAHSILKQTHVGNVWVRDSNMNKNSAETSRTVGQTSNKNGAEIKSINSLEPSSLPTSGEQGSRERQGEDKDSSQFEQKTMSVMRGGEMVQVSYKVYIPKKAPALARRQLRR